MLVKEFQKVNKIIKYFRERGCFKKNIPLSIMRTDDRADLAVPTDDRADLAVPTDGYPPPRSMILVRKLKGAYSAGRS